MSNTNEEINNLPIANFSMVITKASHDKQKGIYRWKMVASDTSEDSYNDNMSLSLFQDFVDRISIDEIAPEDFRSSYWQGGMPYVSISHYPDLNGEAVPGIVESVFVDGIQLKANGEFHQTPLGLACYNAICKDLYAEQKPQNPVRVSIAFLDYGHIHKSNQYEFERKSITDFCPECRAERISGKFSGKIFTKGQLVHLALTRSPANAGTDVEVEKSMTTRKEDAESIVGELVNEIDEKAQLVGKSEAMVIKAEEPEAEIEECAATEVEPEVVPEPIVPDVVENSVVLDRLDKIEQALSVLATKSVEVPVAPSHELDPVYATFKSDYDQIKMQELNSNERLQLLQNSFETFALSVRSNIEAVASEEVEEPVSGIDNEQLVQTLSTALSNALNPLMAKVDLLTAKMQENVVKYPTDTPIRRSIAPNLSMQKDIRSQAVPQRPQSNTPKLRALIERNMQSALGGK